MAMEKEWGSGFVSILDPVESPYKERRRPAFFTDLNLDQVIDRISRDWGENVGKYYAYFPADASCERYRREVYADIRREGVYEALCRFMERMKARRDVFVKKEAVEQKLQRAVWHIREVDDYCGAFAELYGAMENMPLDSRGMLELRGYLGRYLNRKEFAGMHQEAAGLLKELKSFRLVLTYENDRIVVTEGETPGDYDGFLERCFPGQNKRMKNPFETVPELVELEQELLRVFQKKSPDFFRRAEAFYEKYKIYADEILLRFGSELGFYLSFCCFERKMQERGFEFCAPVVAERRQDRGSGGEQSGTGESGDGGSGGEQSGAAKSGSSAEQSGAAKSGSGESVGSGAEQSGAAKSGSGESGGSGAEQSGAAESGSGESVGSGAEQSGAAKSGSGGEQSGAAESGSGESVGSGAEQSGAATSGGRQRQDGGGQDKGEEEDGRERERSEDGGQREDGAGGRRMRQGMYAEGLYDLALACASLGDDREVISNDMEYRDGEGFFVLTGPNQGGKTTFARSLGQMVYLAKMGLEVPARQAGLYPFTDLFTHFSVEESAETGRGKLMDELERLANMMVDSCRGAFVVINELFTTAANYDASIMGKRVLEHFLAANCMGIYVTHLGELSRAHPQVVSLRAMLDERGVQSFKIERGMAAEHADALGQVRRFGLTYEQLKERIQDSQGRGG